MQAIRQMPSKHEHKKETHLKVEPEIYYRDFWGND